MRVLLLNTNRRSDVLAAPPIGLAYIASAAEAAGHRVRFADLCFSRNPLQDTELAIKDFPPEVVGISIRNIDNVNLLYPESYLPGVKEIVGYIRASTRAPIVVGGAGASLCPERVLRELAADFIVTSDGENSFVRLLDCMANGRNPDGIPGVGFLDGQEYRSTEQELFGFSSGNPDVGKWVDMRPYQRLGAPYTVQTSRGCRHQCIYCTYNQLLEGSRLRLRPPVDVVDEIEEALLKYRPESFEFVDSVFNEPTDHCTAILEEIVRRPWKTQFTAMGVSPKGLDSEVLDLMWRAGFDCFMITPESASEKMIESYRKGFTVDDLVRSAEAIRKTEFSVMWYFLIGGPGETNATLQETLDFTERYIVQTRRPPWNMTSFYVGVRLYPGTKLWEIAGEEGFVDGESDPLQQLWYVSKELDLYRAVEQLVDAARLYPEVCPGFDEKFLRLSNLFAAIATIYPMDKPFWRHYWGIANLLIKLGLRRTLRPGAIAKRLRDQLQRQGAPVR